MVRSVLVIYPHWPPSNLVGVHRVRLIVNEMPDLGWRPIVLTVHEDDYEEPHAIGSEALVSEDIEVVKVRARRPLIIGGKRLVGDIGLRAWSALRTKAFELASTRDIDFVWFSLPSWYPCLFGPALHRKFGIPYAIDYQDPWVHDVAAQYKWYHRAQWTVRLARFLEPMALRRVAFLSAINQDYMAGPVARHQRIQRLPNLEVQLGFSQKDHEAAPSDIQPPWPSDKKVILYAGAYWEQGAPLFRELLEALTQVNESHDIDSDFHFAFIGTRHPRLPSLQSIIDELGLSGIASEYPDRIPYLNVLSLLNQSWATMVIGSTAAHYSASKVFQLLLTGKPILGYFHPASEGQEILKDCNAQQYFSPYLSEDASTRKTELRSNLLKLLTTRIDWTPNLEPLIRHSSGSAAKRLVQTFDSCL
ncbi:hypothetical protein N9L83_03285 [Flavobacteriales bacterium]|nr:hypothetical protein [Flavobacteriales bacterium]